METRYKVTHIGYVCADNITEVHKLMEKGKVNFTEMHIENDETKTPCSS